MPAAIRPILPIRPISTFLAKTAAVTRLALANRWTKVAVFVACLAPLAAEIVAWYGWIGQDLGGNPIEDITHETGEWALKFLGCAMAVTPVRKLLRIPELIRYRRMLGLYAFFYAVLHLYTYVWMDKFFDLDAILHDVASQLYIFAGVVSFVLLLPLVLTSTRGWIIRLSGRRWRWVHRLIYVAAIAGVFHYYWLMKADVSDPLSYAAAFAVILGLRAYVTWSPAYRAKQFPAVTSVNAKSPVRGRAQAGSP
jgi:sulfoxide reductase heme-binding subunit YedZ